MLSQTLSKEPSEGLSNEENPDRSEMPDHNACLSAEEPVSSALGQLAKEHLIAIGYRAKEA